MMIGGGGKNRATARSAASRTPAPADSSVLRVYNLTELIFLFELPRILRLAVEDPLLHYSLAITPVENKHVVAFSI